MNSIQKFRYLTVGLVVALGIDIVWSTYVFLKNSDGSDYWFNRLRKLETELEICERKAYPKSTLYGPS